MDNYQKMTSQSQFTAIAQKEEVKYNIIRTLECLRGVFPASLPSFADQLFHYFLPILRDTVKLLEIYENYSSIINAILEMYVDMMEHVLCFLNVVRNL